MEKQLVQAIDRRLAVFVPQGENLAEDEMQLRAAAYLISEIMLPCCCMMCNKQKLLNLLMKTKLCANRVQLAERLAILVYDDLARCNGLG